MAWVKRRSPLWALALVWFAAAAGMNYFMQPLHATVHPNTSTLGITVGSVDPTSMADADFGDFSCSSGTCTNDANSIALTTDTTGNYVTSVTGGAGILNLSAASEGATPTIATDSSEADFLKSGALTCGASTQGKMQVHTTPLQYCDNSATPTLRYGAYADSSGNALTGDTATAFFSAGQIEVARGGTGQDLSASSGLLLDTSGTISTVRWQGGAKLLCPPGMEAAGICKTFTNLSTASFTSAGNVFTIEDLDVVTQMRVFARLSVAPATNSTVSVECDTDSAFGSPTVCAQITGLTTSSSAVVGSWTSLGTAGADCIAASAWCKAGMGNGDGTADPVAVEIGYALR